MNGSVAARRKPPGIWSALIESQSEITDRKGKSARMFPDRQQNRIVGRNKTKFERAIS
jgi:hypothetical protein